MGKWNLSINNIGGFANSHDFELTEGLNIIIGDNATGKTTLFNSLKLLNAINSSKEKENEVFDYKDFLHDKTKSGRIILSNQDKSYEISIKSPIVKITSFIESSSVDDSKILTVKKKKLISKNPNILKFVYLDKQNKLMESIEYSGSLEDIKNEIINLSKIKFYELILKHVKSLDLEYKERKEKELKHLNDQRKEFELKIRDNLKKAKDLENQLSKVSINDKNFFELKEKKEILELENQKYNNIRLKELDSLNQEYNKLVASIERDQNSLKNLKGQKSELDEFINLKNIIMENLQKIEKIDEDLRNSNKKKEDLMISKRLIEQLLFPLEETRHHKKNASICVHCLNPIDLGKISAKINEYIDKRRELNLKISKLNSNIRDLEREHEKINDLLNNQKNIPSKIAELSAKINTLEKRIETNQNKKINLGKAIAENNSKLESIQEKIKRLQQEIIEISDQDENVKEKHTELLTKINIIKDENDIISNKKNLLVQRIIVLPDNYNKIIERTEIVLKNLREHVEEFYFKFIDHVNTQLEILLKELEWSFENVFIDDDLNLVIKDSNGRPQKFASLSDFEKKSIAILILLIVKNKYFPNYPIFAIDEHLNAADSKRFIKFIPFLFEHVKDSNIKFLVITTLPQDVDSEFLEQFEGKTYETISIYHKS